jgi:S1-C subfamily serine protease
MASWEQIKNKQAIRPTLFGFRAFNLYFSLLIAFSLAGQFAFAGPEEDRNEALKLFNAVKKVLEAKLTRPEAPENYHLVYNQFQSKQAEIEKEISSDPLNIAAILSKHLLSPGMSHLGFKKLPKGSFGFESIPLGDGAEKITGIEPWGPFSKEGIQVGDVVQTISNLPASQALQNTLVAGHYDTIRVTFLMNREVRIFLNKSNADRSLAFGWTLSNLGEKVMVTSLTPGGAAEKAGIRVNDEIDEINGEKITQQILSALPFYYSESVQVRIKTRNLNIKPVPENDLKWGSLGINSKNIDTDAIEVSAVIPGGPADLAGIRAGDSILALDGIPYKLARLYKPGEKVLVQVKRASGQIVDTPVTMIARAEYNRTYFKEIEHNGKKAVYMRIADFSGRYEPEVVHQAFEAAEKTQFAVIDLRSNGGGRAEHLLSYLIQAQVPYAFHVGEYSYFEWAHLQHKNLNNALVQFLGSSGTLEQQDRPDTRYAKGTYQFLRDRACRYCAERVWSPGNHMLCNFDPGVRISVVDKALEDIARHDPSPFIFDLVNDRKRSFRVLAEQIVNEICQVSAPGGALYPLIVRVEYLKLETERLQTLDQQQLEKVASTLLQAQADVEKFRSEIFEKHLQWITAWFHETSKIFTEVSKQMPFSARNQVLIPADFSNSSRFAWSARVKSPIKPFRGKVVFLIDQNSFCGAEACALAPFEYQRLRDQKTRTGMAYNQELFPQEVFIIGQSKGGAQGLKTQTFKTPLGDFELGYPVFDIYSFVEHQHLEGSGVKGIPIRNDSLDQHGLDPALVQAIERMAGAFFGF